MLYIKRMQTHTNPGPNNFWWQLRGANNKIFAFSETYFTKSNRERAIRSVNKHLNLKVKD